MQMGAAKKGLYLRHFVALAVPFPSEGVLPPDHIVLPSLLGWLEVFFFFVSSCDLFVWPNESRLCVLWPVSNLAY